MDQKGERTNIKSAYWRLSRPLRRRTLCLPDGRFRVQNEDREDPWHCRTQSLLNKSCRTRKPKQGIFVLQKVSKWLTQCTKDFICWPDRQKTPRNRYHVYPKCVSSEGDGTRRKNSESGGVLLMFLRKQGTTDRHWLFRWIVFNNTHTRQSGRSLYQLVTYHVFVIGFYDIRIHIYLKTTTTNRVTTRNDKRFVTLRREP